MTWRHCATSCTFNLQVAEMANVPPSVIANAKRKARELEIFDYRSKKQAKHPSSKSTEDIIQQLKMIPLKSMPNSDAKLAALGRVLGVV